MDYKDLPQFKKPFVLQHTQGFGEQGGNGIDYLEYVQDFDTLEKLLEFGKQKYPKHSSGWTFDSLTYTINTSTEIGKQEYAKFEERFKGIEANIKAHPENYISYDIEGIGKITIEYNEAFDESRKINH